MTDRPPSELEPLLTTEAAAAALATTPAALTMLRYRGRGPRWVKVGRLVRYRPSSIAAWIEKRTEGDVTPEVLDSEDR